MAFESIIQKIAESSPALGAQMQQYPWMFPLLIAQIVMKLIFYPIALYHSAKRQKKAWFVILFIGMIFLNDLGLLPILYLIFNRDKKKHK